MNLCIAQKGYRKATFAYSIWPKVEDSLGRAVATKNMAPSKHMSGALYNGEGERGRAREGKRERGGRERVWVKYSQLEKERDCIKVSCSEREREWEGAEETV